MTTSHPAADDLAINVSVALGRALVRTDNDLLNQRFADRRMQEEGMVIRTAAALAAGWHPDQIVALARGVVTGLSRTTPRHVALAYLTQSVRVIQNLLAAAARFPDLPGNHALDGGTDCDAATWGSALLFVDKGQVRTRYMRLQAVDIPTRAPNDAGLAPDNARLLFDRWAAAVPDVGLAAVAAALGLTPAEAAAAVADGTLTRDGARGALSMLDALATAS